MEKSVGIRPHNLHGVDLSPRAIEVNRAAHPLYKLQVVTGFDYQAPKVDLVYHSGVLCQIQDHEYEKYCATVEVVVTVQYYLQWNLLKWTLHSFGDAVFMVLLGEGGNSAGFCVQNVWPFERARL